MVVQLNPKEMVSCSICFENVAEISTSDGKKQVEVLTDDLACLQRCYHLFHDTCLSPWRDQNPSCPNCRVSILENCEVITGNHAGICYTNHLNGEEEKSNLPPLREPENPLQPNLYDAEILELIRVILGRPVPQEVRNQFFQELVMPEPHPLRHVRFNIPQPRHEPPWEQFRANNPLPAEPRDEPPAPLTTKIIDRIFACVAIGTLLFPVIMELKDKFLKLSKKTQTGLIIFGSLMIINASFTSKSR